MMCLGFEPKTAGWGLRRNHGAMAATLFNFYTHILQNTLWRKLTSHTL